MFLSPATPMSESSSELLAARRISPPKTIIALGPQDHMLGPWVSPLETNSNIPVNQRNMHFMYSHLPYFLYVAAMLCYSEDEEFLDEDFF
jgi:hypothetical protein